MSEAPESTISTSLRLTKALSLARQGKLKPAEQLLAPENVVPTNALELHALAALVTHEGNYLRALQLWRLLQQQQPDHPEARRMIPMIELWVNRPSWHRHFRLGVVVLVAVILGVIALWALDRFISPVPSKPAGASVSPTPAAAPFAAPSSAPVSRPIQVPAKNSRTR